MSLPSRLYSWKDANANPIRYYTDNTTIYVGMPLYNNQGTDTGRTIGFIQNNTFDVACTLTIVPTPSDATVTLTSSGYTQSGNSITVRTGTNVNYTVSKSGYVTQNGTVIVTGDQSLSITLASFCTLTINPTPSNATVTLTASGYTQSGNSITVPSGTNVSYSVAKSNCITTTGSETVTSTHTTNITVRCKLTVNTTPSDATVTFSTGTVSGHECTVPYNTQVTYTISKSGYTTSQEYSKTVTQNETINAPALEIPETLLATYGVGTFNYTIPNQYNYVKFEIAGACGGRNWQSDGAGIYAENSPGKGAIIQQTINNITTRSVQGTVGARPTMTYADEYRGGNGYHNGESSGIQSVTIQYITGGGGGGSSAVTFNNVTYEACGGGGRSSLTQLASQTFGGKGGGTYGGARQTATYTNGNDATDPGKIGLNDGDGYVKIYAGYR